MLFLESVGFCGLFTGEKEYLDFFFLKSKREKKRKGSGDSESGSLRRGAHRQRSHDPVPVPIILTFKRFDSDGTEIL